MALGLRDLSESASARIAAEKSGATAGGFDVAELHAPFSHQEIILRDALGLGDNALVNPSGGALASNPIMSAGLIRIGEVAKRIWSGEADRGVAHATSGPCLQHNLVAVLEASDREGGISPSSEPGPERPGAEGAESGKLEGA